MIKTVGRLQHEPAPSVKIATDAIENCKLPNN